MAKKNPKKEKVLTSTDISKMSVEEVLNELLFQSHFTTSMGPKCSCKCNTLTHMMGMIPDKLCEQAIEDVDLTKVPNFSTTISSLCPCQKSHYYTLKLEKGCLEYDVTDGQDMDNRKLRLPNFN